MARASQNRNRRTFLKTGGAVVTGGLFAGCLGGGGGDGGDGSGDGGDGGATMTSSKTLEEKAKDEGQVNLIGQARIKEFNKQFQEDTGIETNYQQISHNEMGTKVLNEYNAGSVSNDVAMTGQPQFQEEMLKQGPYRAPINDELMEITTWHGQEVDTPDDGLIGEKLLEIDLAYVFVADVVAPDDRPKTFDELVSGDYTLTMDTEEQELIVVLDRLYGRDTTKQMLKGLYDVSDLKKSHSTAAQEALAGSYAGGIFKFDDIYVPEEQRGELYPLTEVYDTTNGGVPMISIPNFAAMLTDSPHPNAGEYWFKYHMENYFDFINEEFTPIPPEPWTDNPPEGLVFLPPKIHPQGDLFEQYPDQIRKLGWQDRDALGEAAEVFQEWVVKNNWDYSG